jgi:hypothetical protein
MAGIGVITYPETVHSRVVPGTISKSSELIRDDIALLGLYKYWIQQMTFMAKNPGEPFYVPFNYKEQVEIKLQSTRPHLFALPPSSPREHREVADSWNCTWRYLTTGARAVMADFFLCV